jgi:ubiquinone/menaquinone biosynthesis C-methylase UbiE
MSQKDKSKTVNQRDVNHVWGHVWKDEDVSAEKLFTQRLFVEGYPIFKKHVPPLAKSFLEVGGGTGRYGLRFAQENPELHVTITDVVDESVNLISRFKSELGLPNVTVAKEDAFALSFPEGTFDVVFCDAVIQHIPQYQNAIKEMIRVLKPGGTLIVSAVNSWNIPHTLYKRGTALRGKEYAYGHERSFSGRELRALFGRYYMQNIVVDGFYFAYGVYRWKVHYPIFKTIGGALNRVTKFLDRVSGRSISRYFGFEVFAVAQKVQLRVQHSGIVQMPSVENPELGTLMVGEGEKNIPFDMKRFYLIKDIPDFHAVRGGHAHKTLDQVIFCLSGSFQLRIDDGVTYQKLVLTSSGFGIRLGPKLWHSMRRFSKDCVILVLASNHYSESDYIRNYDDFKRYITEHP